MEMVGIHYIIIAAKRYLGSTLFLTFACSQSLGTSEYCRRESKFVQNLDVRRQNGGPRGVTHQGNANANERVFTVLKDIFDVSGSDQNFKGITMQYW